MGRGSTDRFYEAVLGLSDHARVPGLLAEALELAVGLTGARLAYVELHSAGGAVASWASAGEGPIDAVRAAISSTIVRESMACGEVVRTVSASQDPRFSMAGSIQRHAIDAVVCVPVGQPTLGVVYLQGGELGDEAVDLVGHLGRQLGLVGERLLPRRVGAEDLSQPYRDKVAAKGLVGRTPAVGQLLKRLHAASAVDVDVLIHGATGTGKNVVAAALHGSSARAPGPFVVVPCPGIASQLFESDLFGAKRGSYTGSTRDRKGFIAEADGGTLVLDEVTEIPLAQQAKLLHFLQTRTYFVVGESTPTSSDVRVVACTNRDPEQAIADGLLREDLYFRLRRFRIPTPSLDDRRDDIAELAEVLLARCAARFGATGLVVRPSLRQLLERMDWPGNVRQLEATLEEAAAMALAEGATSVGPEHLLDGAPDDSEACPKGFHEATWWFQARHLRACLRDVEGNRAEAARRLGMSRSHFYTLVERFGLEDA